MRLLDEYKLKQNIDEIAKYDLDNNNVLGASYFVWQNGGVVFKKHFGNADFTENKKVDDNTIYRLASMTKPITAVAILILVDRGLISLDEPVSKYIPEFEIIFPEHKEGEFFFCFGTTFGCATWLDTIERII